MDGMTQYLTKINRPGLDMMLSKTMYAGGRRRVCTSDTPPEACSVAGTSFAPIGRWASVGGSVGLADWSRMLGAVDRPPGGVWIDFIRQTLGHLFLLPCSATGTPFVLLDLRYIG